jgi:hypothetical protein
VGLFFTDTKTRSRAENDIKMTTPTINELVQRDDLNFKMFLSTARITDDIQGDLIADMKRARDLPNDFGESDQLRRYLRDRRACDGAVDAVAGVWRRYRAWLNRRNSEHSA